MRTLLTAAACAAGLLLACPAAGEAAAVQGDVALSNGARAVPPPSAVMAAPCFAEPREVQQALQAEGFAQAGTGLDGDGAIWALFLHPDGRFVVAVLPPEGLACLLGIGGAWVGGAGAGAR